MQTEAVENNLRNYKETYTKTTLSFRTKLGELNNEKSSLMTQKQQLEAKVTALEVELRTAKVDTETAAVLQSSSQEVVALTSKIVRGYSLRRSYISPS